MENEKKFSAALFGFKKKDVNAYILSLSADFAAQIETLNQKNKEMTQENIKLFSRVEELERERAFISDTLLRAKRQAEAIIAAAEAESERKRLEVEAQLEDVRKTIAEETKKLAQLREGARAALSGYAESLDKIKDGLQGQPEKPVAPAQDGQAKAGI